ncbi:hypothetical protein RJZ56_001377 [Blastomyces dermatitidis]|uniref:Uncharacterized protein n=2 Tax=Blastomyces TaxID=229219 RepID=A0A179UP36_BLAGS|nr:uncharacterized protein BDBG_05549 [Blastomyces gilchristii SLH14081]XP_045274879.1 uncharacterized protein BDCG_02704 [Blastomyces dermatitidis ER-3]EEQ87584.2 hypothetical protein BDCG_02704 [Blastomyces dermatitidis ER-3]OAT09845.1 hypothetical protein BDBG_05549 [Blastomyces gilchristii SLH14081]
MVLSVRRLSQRPVHFHLGELEVSTCAHPDAWHIALPALFKRFRWTRPPLILCAAGWSPHAGDRTVQDTILALKAEAARVSLLMIEIARILDDRPTNRGVLVAS